MPGIIVVIQTFGSRLNFHPHLHILTPEGGEDQDDRFPRVSRFNDSFLKELFTREVFSLLLREKLIGLSLVHKILSWRNTRFNVHSQLRASDKEEPERLGKSIIRPLLSLKQISFSEQGDKFSYQDGKKRAEKEQMDYLEFIVRTTSNVPEKGQVMIRYFGIYANAHWGKMRKRAQSLSDLLIIEEECPRIPQPGLGRDDKESLRG